MSQCNTNQLITPIATLTLNRFPLRNKEILRAWDAADELLLNYLYEHCDDLVPKRHQQETCHTPTSSTPTVLVVNDAFGALACSLAHVHTKSWGDSHLAHQATRYNAEHNHLPLAPECIASTSELNGFFDYIIIKIPKTIALLEYQLIKLNLHIHANSQIIAAGMTKYIHTSQIKLFERYIGPTTTSLAVKKARMIHPTLNNKYITSPSTQCPYPTQYYDNELNLTVSNHANVFSREKLDIGTRFMLKQFKQLPNRSSTPYIIADLGCGNGLLGIMAKRHYEKHLQLNFIDESYMALASAKENVTSAFPNHDCTQDDIHYFISDGFEQTPLTNIDLILCNPPFHQSHTIGTYVATRMFQQSKKRLKKGGCLWVIGNRHLNYTTLLKRIFGNCRIIAHNKKFQVLSAVLQG